MHICSHKINDVGKKNQRTYHERFIQIQFKITIALFNKENKRNIIKVLFDQYGNNCNK